MIALVLDSEAVSLLAINKANDVTTDHVKALVDLHLAEGGSILVPANVIAETRRGRYAARVDRVLNAALVVDLDRDIAAQAGSILEVNRRGSSDLADATVAATAILTPSSAVTIVTSERSSGSNDLESFISTHQSRVSVINVHDH